MSALDGFDLRNAKWQRWRILRFDDFLILKLIKLGHTQKHIAATLNVTPQAICMRLKALEDNRTFEEGDKEAVIFHLVDEILKIFTKH
jgi:predicted transcriptional regulator